MAKQRNSGIELLRIIAILMVILYHWVWHGGIRTFSGYEFGANIVFMQFLMTLGRTGCCIFALITGYFMISSQKKNYYPKVISLTLTTHMYYLMILAVMFVTKAVPVSKTLGIKSLLPLLFGTWYIIAYILLLLIVPFLNPWLRQLDQKTHLRLTVTLLLIWSVIPTVSAGAWSFSDIDFFLVMYVLGSYLRLHPIERKLPWGIMALGSWILMFLSVIGFDILGIITDRKGLFDKAFYFGKLNSVIAVFLSVSMLMWCSRMKFQSRIVNTLGGTTLGIYLIHNNFLLRNWAFRKVFPNLSYIENPYLNVLAKTAVIFFAGAAVELIRAATVGKLFDRIGDRIGNRIDKNQMSGSAQETK